MMAKKNGLLNDFSELPYDPADLQPAYSDYNINGYLKGNISYNLSC